VDKKAATTAGSGQQIRVGSTLPSTDRQRLLELPLIRPHLIPVGTEKRPLTRAWEQPERIYTDTLLRHAPAIGLRLGYPVLAVDFDPKPDNLSQAERTFEQRTGRSSAELPISWTVTSGKPGRRQVLLQVDPAAVPWLKPWSRDGLELRWRGQQSVIHGHHPETGRYSWLPSRAPWECQLATAPDWLLEAFKPAASEPVRYQPKRAPSCLEHWGPADWCRYYLRYWPASGLDARSEWWPTVVVMRRAGLTFEEAFAWSAASNKHTGGKEFRRQWDKAERCSAPYAVEWLGARTRAARHRQGVRRG
jgi:hypothetical protein